MKKFFKRRGQASIEFALILPLFALMLFALIYLGFLFIDVVTLDSAAAAAARNAKISLDDNGNVEYDNNGNVKFNVDSTLENKICNGTRLFLYWYEVDSNSPKLIETQELIIEETEEYIKKGYFITYGVRANLNTDNRVLRMVLPEKYTVVKTAYKEYEEPEEP